ncbi:MAG: hypothetical protein J0L91_04680, partial [Burkholderiales bacterium]|nr:hypothetical protein [Burkholderiales bacterium]
DMSLERVKAVVQEAHDHPLPVMMGFSRRFDPNHRALREAVQAFSPDATAALARACVGRWQAHRTPGGGR